MGTTVGDTEACSKLIAGDKRRSGQSVIDCVVNDARLRLITKLNVESVYTLVRKKKKKNLSLSSISDISTVLTWLKL